MPTIEEVQDETFRDTAANNDESDWDDESEFSDYSSDEETKERGLIIPEETIWERITALKDIVSPSTRRSIASKISTLTSYSSTALLFGGRAAWVLTTTSLLIGLPYALAVEDEMRISQQERDLASQQQGAQQMLGAKPPGQGTPAPGAPGGSSPQGIRPPGF